MADNPTLDNADLTDFTIATDEVQVGGTQGVAQVQFVKLVDGTLNGTDPINGTSVNGLEVDVTRIAAGDNNIGNVDVVTLPALAAGANKIGSVDTDADATIDSAIPATGIFVAGTDGSLARGLKTDSDGNLQVEIISTIPGSGATELGKAEDAAHASGDVGVMTLGVRNDAGTALADDGDYIPLSFDSSGAVRVTGGGGGTQYTEADTDASITGTAVMWEDSADTLRVSSATTPLPVNPVVSSQDTDSVAAVLVATTAAPTGYTALSSYMRISTADTNLASVKSSAGQLYWLTATCTNASPRYIHLYNKASAPVIASDSALLLHTFLIPGDSGGRGFVMQFPVPITFSTGIALALSTSSAGTGSVAAGEIIINGGYR